MRRSRRQDAPVPVPAPATPAEREVDDLPGFFDSPPGSPAAPATAPAPPPPAPEVVPDRHARRPGRRGLVAAAAVLAVVAVGTTVVLTTGRDDARGTHSPPAATGRSTTSPAPTTAAPLTAAAAGDLADVDLSPGDDGATAELVATGVVLERQAVGVTVAYPQLSVSDDGTQSIAHLDLTVWNCLADEPPADPVAADCRRSLPEYADLGSPDLQVTRTGDGFRLTGTFATYTRPNGSAPTYTGRSYPVEVDAQRTPDGATGTVALGDGEATVVPPSRIED